MPPESISRQETIPEPRLKDYIDILFKRRSVIISFFVAVITISGIYNITRPNIYAASAQILIQDPIKLYTDMPEVQQSIYNIKSQLEVMKSMSIMASAAERLDLISKYPQILGSDLKTAARRAAGMVNIKQVGESRIFDVSVKTADPNLAAELANGLVDEYIEKDIMTSYLLSKDLMKKINEEKRTRPGDSFGKPREASKDDIILSLPSVTRNPKIMELKARKEALENKLSAYSQRYTDKHPKVIETKREIQSIREQIKSAANEIVGELKDVTSGKFQVSNVKIIEYAATPQWPIGPNRMKNFLLLTIMAFFTGCSLALVVDYLDNTVKTQDDVERHIKLPYLGYVPLIKEKINITKEGATIPSHIIIKPDEHTSPLLEAFRNIRTSIIFSAPPGALKSMLVTSAFPKEGKSTITFNLAITMANDGSRTLLVDGDMRRPSLHKMSGLENSEGLSNYLTSKISIDKVIQETPYQNLKLITCGPIPPNPSELFSSYRMKELLEEAKTKFDRIIFDSAPIFGISDSVVLAKALDGVIQVIKFGKVTWEMANRSKERLQNLGVKITGIIINGVDTEKESYYYKYYDYHYHKYYE